MKRGSFLLANRYFVFGIMFLFFLGIVSAAPINDDLHINLQTTDSQGKVITGTFSFRFDITTDLSCTNTVYTRSASLATDSRGIVSYYLTGTNLDYTQQYYLCYYRDGQLIDTVQIARTPYAFTAKNVNLSGVLVDSNLDATGFNVTADNFFGDGSGLTNLDFSGLNLSHVNYWTKSGNDLFYNEGRVGVGTNNPLEMLDVNGTIRAFNSAGILRVGTSGGASFFSSETSGNSMRFMLNSGGGAETKMVIMPNGRVGIGRLNPSQALDVNGSIILNSTIYTPTDESLRLTPGGSGNLYLGNAGNGLSLFHYSDSNDGIYTMFNHDSSGNYRISVTGNGEIQLLENVSVLGDLNVSGNVMGEDICLSDGTCLTEVAQNASETVWDYNGNDIYYNNGNVGIGTSSPDNVLEVVGSGSDIPFVAHYSETSEGLPADLPNYLTSLFVRNVNSNYANLVTYIGGSNAWTGLTFGDSDSYNKGSILYYNSDDSMGFKVNSNDAMKIDSSGQVGIGTSSPSSRLHINGGVGNLSTGLTFGDGDSGIYQVADNQLDFAVGGVRVLRFNSQGFDFANNNWAKMMREAPTATNPVFVPGGVNDDDTGIGHAGADQLSLIAGGSEIVRVETTGINVSGDIYSNSDICTGTACFNEVAGLAQAANASIVWSKNGDDIYYENGNVGVGVNAPESNMHIRGDVIIEL